MKKKLVFVFFGLIFFSVILSAQSLDEAIIGAAVKISSDLPANASAAVLNFRSDSEKLNEYVINELYGAIVRNRRIVPVKPEQSQLQSIRGDLGSNMAEIVNKEAAQRIGRLMGALYLITGSIQRIGSEYRINFNAIDINAEIKSLYSASLNPQNDSQFALLLSISTESNLAVVSTKTQKIKKQVEPSVYDVVKNWISINPAFLGIGVSYEYMLNSKISLGTNIYWQFVPPYNYNKKTKYPYKFEHYTIDIDAAFRFYPWGKTFFMGNALGFSSINGIADEYYSLLLNKEYYSTYYAYALSITPEIGWKLLKNVYNKNQIFLQWGLALLTELKLGKINYNDPRVDQVNFSGLNFGASLGQFGEILDRNVIYIFPRLFLGIGYSF
jgi:TolB-like protein